MNIEVFSGKNTCALRLTRPIYFFFIFISSFAFCLDATAREAPVKSLLEMRQANTVVQKWDLSCGAAALTTLLNFQHGENLSEKEVAIALMKRQEYLDNPELIQIREGFSLLDLKRYADARGYKGAGFGKLSLEDLVEKAPIIVAITTHGYNHFVIFRGMRENRVLLADPAWGNRTMLVDEFMKNWIEYPEIGHIGFTVERPDGSKVYSPLQDNGNEYVMLR